MAIWFKNILPFFTKNLKIVAHKILLHYVLKGYRHKKKCRLLKNELFYEKNFLFRSFRHFLWKFYNFWNICEKLPFSIFHTLRTILPVFRSNLVKQLSNSDSTGRNRKKTMPCSADSFFLVWLCCHIKRSPIFSPSY